MTPDDRDLMCDAFGPGRSSARRLAIARAAEAAETAFTVDQLARSCETGGPSPGAATVYRAVAAMLRQGFLEQVGERDGAALYVRCGADGHHHHVVCTECGAVGHAPCPLDEEALAAATASGFTVTSHEVAVYGRCGDCDAARGARE